MDKKSKTKGFVFLGAWFVLIWAGILDKHLLGHEDLMVFFHLPAAVCLVISCYELSRGVRAKYRRQLRRYENKSEVIGPIR